MRHTLSVLVENKPGVLTRVSGLFARRAFNIKSLTVGETEHPDISRMTIIVDADTAPIEQVKRQLGKLINVLKIVELNPDEAVERRMLLMKVRADDTLLNRSVHYPSWRRCCGHLSPTASPNSFNRAPWRSAAVTTRLRIN